MKDVTFGVKVPEDLRDKINEMMKTSGLVGREFMQELVDSYLLDKNKQEIPQMAEEIKELQRITHRINDMYLYLGTRFQNIVEVKEKEKQALGLEVEKGKENFDDNIEQYKDEVEKAIEEMVKLEEELGQEKKKNQDAIQMIEEIKGYNENYKELNSQYKTTIENLTKELESFKVMKEENDLLLKDNKHLKENNDSLASDLWFSKREIEKLTDKLIKTRDEYNRRADQVEEQHHLDRKASLLEVQLESQKKIEFLNDKIASIQKEYNDKLKDVYVTWRTKGQKEADDEG